MYFLSPEEATTRRDFGDGHTTAEMTAQKFSSLFEPYQTPMSYPRLLPAIGSIILFDGKDITETYGHTAIVIAVKKIEIERFVQVFQSNADGLHQDSQTTVSEWISIDKADVFGLTAGWASPLNSAE